MPDKKNRFSIFNSNTKMPKPWRENRSKRKVEIKEMNEEQCMDHIVGVVKYLLTKQAKEPSILKEDKEEIRKLLQQNNTENFIEEVCKKDGAEGGLGFALKNAQEGLLGEMKLSDYTQFFYVWILNGLPDDQNYLLPRGHKNSDTGKHVDEYCKKNKLNEYSPCSINSGEKLEKAEEAVKKCVIGSGAPRL